MQTADTYRSYTLRYDRDERAYYAFSPEGLNLGPVHPTQWRKLVDHILKVRVQPYPSYK